MFSDTNLFFKHSNRQSWYSIAFWIITTILNQESIFSNIAIDFLITSHELIPLLTDISSDTLVASLIKLICMLLKWKYIQEKILPFWPLCWEKQTSYFLKNVLSQSPRLECSYRKIFIPVTDILVTKTEISVTRPTLLLISTYQNFYKGNSSEVRSWKPSQLSWLGSYEKAVSWGFFV